MTRTAQLQDDLDNLRRAHHALEARHEKAVNRIAALERADREPRWWTPGANEQRADDPFVSALEREMEGVMGRHELKDHQLEQVTAERDALLREATQLQNHLDMARAERDQARAAHKVVYAELAEATTKLARVRATLEQQ